MKLSQKQCEFILGSKFCIVATSDKSNKPRACVVIPEMAFDNKVILADCQMSKTRENIKQNPNVFLSFYDNALDQCMKCDGTAEYLTSGKEYETTKDKLAKQNLFVNGIISVSISSIYEHKEYS